MKEKWKQVKMMECPESIEINNMTNGFLATYIRVYKQRLAKKSNYKLLNSCKKMRPGR